MPSIIAHSGLGLFNATQSGLSGSPFAAGSLGQSQVGLNFNVATGNAVVWDGDQTRVGQGVDARFGRTYNSQGHLTDSDGWRFSFERELLIGSGTVTRVTGDEAQTTFTVDASNSNRWLSSDGVGAHDQIKYNSSSNTYTYTVSVR